MILITEQNNTGFNFIDLHLYFEESYHTLMGSIMSTNTKITRRNCVVYTIGKFALRPKVRRLFLPTTSNDFAAPCFLRHHGVRQGMETPHPRVSDHVPGAPRALAPSERSEPVGPTPRRGCQARAHLLQDRPQFAISAVEVQESGEGAQIQETLQKRAATSAIKNVQK